MTDSYTWNFWIKRPGAYYIFIDTTKLLSQKITAFALATVMFESFHFPILSPALNTISILYLCWFCGWTLVFCCFYFPGVEHLNFFFFAYFLLFFLSIYRSFLHNRDINPLSITVLQIFSPNVARIFYPVYCLCLNLFMVSLLDSFLVGLVTQDPEFLFPYWQPLCKRKEHRYRQLSLFLTRETRKEALRQKLARKKNGLLFRARKLFIFS